MRLMEGNLQQKIDERLAEQRELEAIDEGRYYTYFSCFGCISILCMLVGSLLVGRQEEHQHPACRN